MPLKDVKNSRGTQAAQGKGQWVALWESIKHAFSTHPPSPDCCLNPRVRLPCHLGELCAPKPCTQACRWMVGSHPLAPKSSCQPRMREPQLEKLWQVPSGLWEASSSCGAVPCRTTSPPLPGRAMAMASKAELTTGSMGAVVRRDVGPNSSLRVAGFQQ